MEGDLKRLMITEPGTILAGAGEKRREIVEAGLGDIKRGEGELPAGWEWIWVEDPWTGKTEKLCVPKEEADAWSRRELSPKPSYWVNEKLRSGGGS